MRKVVIINQDSGYLMTDIANAYAEVCDEVVLMCGRLVKHERCLDSRIRIDEICTYRRGGMMKRLCSWVKASIQIFHKLRNNYKDYEIVYVSNPPLACFCSLFLKNKFKIIEFDVYPDALKSIGISHNNLIFKSWAELKKRLFRKAEYIYTLSEGMKSIVSQYTDINKIKYIPLWSASSKFHPIEKEDNVFIRQNGLEGKFVVMYSGNIGHTHNVECLIEVAKKMRNYTNILFLIIGVGKKKEELINIVNQEQLTNVSFLPFQEVEMLPYSLSSADVGVITLDETVSKASVPSKTFNLLAAGVPLLAIAGADTEIFRLIQKYNCGKAIDKRNVGEMIEYIIELSQKKAKRKELQNNSIAASTNFTVANAKQYL